MKNYTTLFLTAILILTATFSQKASAQGMKHNKPSADSIADTTFGVPSNDSFATPMVLTLNGSAISMTSGNVSATKETGEPKHAENAGGQSVWFSFTPQATTVARIRTTSANMDTLLAVYTGGAVDNLTSVGWNDDCMDASVCTGGASLVDLMLVAGTTYRIAVDGYSDGTSVSAGAFTLEINALAAPAQDNYANALSLGATNAGSIAGTNFNATSEAGEPSHFDVAQKSVWYKWTPNTAYSVDFELTENFTSAIKIYRAYVANPTISQLQSVASAGDYSGFTSAKYRTTFHADANITYYIAIDGWGNNAAQKTGNFQLKYYTHRLRYSFRGYEVWERSSLTVFRPTDGTWYRLSSYSGFSSVQRQFGANGDTPVPADYDGNGYTDWAVTRNVNGVKNWYIAPSSFLDYSYGVQWGAAGDTPVTGDFDNDGVTDMTVIRQTQNGLAWYVRKSTDGGLRAFIFGANSDKPVIGDFDGDGATDIAVTRNVGGNLVWYILKSSFGSGLAATYTQYASIQFGFAGDRATHEDFDGDGKTDIAVFRPSNGTWYVLRSSDGQLQTQQFGTMGDRPQPADLNGDGKAEFVVFRPSNGTWYTSTNPATNYGAVQWGADGDVPVTSMVTLSE